MINATAELFCGSPTVTVRIGSTVLVLPGEGLTVAEGPIVGEDDLQAIVNAAITKNVYPFLTIIDLVIKAHKKERLFIQQPDSWEEYL